MKYLEAIRKTANTPQQLEALYQSARQASETGEFSQDLHACYQESPDNVLLAAWYYRLQNSQADSAESIRPNLRQPHRRNAGLWIVAVPMALISGLLIGLLASANEQFLQHIPYVVLLWAPIAASAAIIFLALAARGNYRRAILGIGLLVIASAYVLLIAPSLKQVYSNHYLDQMAIHLPLLAWIAIGITLLGLRSLVNDRFAFLIKSIEAAITAGLYLIAGVAFGVITIGMLQALSVKLPETWMLFLAGGGFGLIPIIAIASIYDPRQQPGEQDFSQGLSKFIANMMRLLLPLTLIVLVIYVLIIPFNFLEPFRNRDVLIVYNIMLFAVMGLILGAIPIQPEDLAPTLKSTLRYGILAVAALAILVSLYAFAAILYRTFTDTLTMNRLIIIGWNVINTTILGVLVYKMARSDKNAWVDRVQAVFSKSMLAYVVWDLFVIFAIPLIFR
jgi:hypothetical protein